MNEEQKHLEQIAEIRDIMNRNTRFLSLSGLSGVFAGIYAIVGAGIAYQLLLKYTKYSHPRFHIGYFLYHIDYTAKITHYLFIDAICILTMALGTGAFFTYRKAKREKANIWSSASKNAVINLAIPLATGGLFCLIMMYHGNVIFIAPATLIFYGLALINASKFTFKDVRYLGMLQVALGLISAIYIGYGLLFWVAGFGILHIVYGITMYYKYER